MMRWKPYRTLLSAAVVMAGALAVPASASAATDDSFTKCTDTWACDGRVRFVDYGEGKPGGGKNDDYIVCEDNFSYYTIGCWVWLDGNLQGGVESGGDGAVVWEPKAGWNVKKGQYVGIKVCYRYDFDNDWMSCAQETRRSFDG
jgi:hypothetical protein